MKNAKIKAIMKKARVRSLGRKRKNPRTQLKILWHQGRKSFKPKQLIYIVTMIDYLPLMKKVVAEFLNKDDPTFNDFYCMLEKTKEALEKDEYLKRKFWKKCLALCTIDNLAELSELGEDEATTELFDKIERGSVRNNKAKQVLIRQFEKFTEKKIRMELWERIKKLDPNEEELTYILDLESIYSYPEITLEAEKLLRERHRPRETKPMKRLLDIAKQIKTKRGQR